MLTCPSEQPAKLPLKSLAGEEPAHRIARARTEFPQVHQSCSHRGLMLKERFTCSHWVQKGKLYVKFENTGKALPKYDILQG